LPGSRDELTCGESWNTWTHGSGLALKYQSPSELQLVSQSEFTKQVTSNFIENLL